MSRGFRLCALLFLSLSIVFSVRTSQGQAYSSEQVEVAPPEHRIQPPPASSSIQQLENVGDVLRVRKAYLDALDYYQAALAKDPHNSRVYNKAGIVELELQRYREAAKDFSRAIQADRTFADAHNNLGVVEYLEKKNARALKEYKKAIQLNANSASFYSNLAAAYFSQKEYQAATVAYAKALQLDPDIFERTSRDGVAGRISSPQDRARYDYVIAGLYAKIGNNTRSLECLRRAMEEGYKDVQKAITDPEFASLRKDPRFTELMASRPTAISQ